LVEEDFPASPETLQTDLDSATVLEALAGRKVAVVVLREETVDGPVLVENGPSFGLCGMGSEDRLHTDPGKVGGDFLGCPSLVAQAGELVSP
jgi:hypothetical protein